VGKRSQPEPWKPTTRPENIGSDAGRLGRGQPASNAFSFFLIIASAGLLAPPSSQV